MRLKVNGRIFLKVVGKIMAGGCGAILFIWFVVSFVGWTWHIPLSIYGVGALLRLFLVAAVLVGLTLSVEEDLKNED